MVITEQQLFLADKFWDQIFDTRENLGFIIIISEKKISSLTAIDAFRSLCYMEAIRQKKSLLKSALSSYFHGAQ